MREGGGFFAIGGRRGDGGAFGGHGRLRGIDQGLDEVKR